MINNITFGSDPEYFLKNKLENLIISSIPFVRGDKYNPEPLGDGFFILKDNVLVEGNIPPTEDPIKFMHNLIELKSRILEYFSKINSALGIHHADCADIFPHFLTHPEALLFGCSPYMNAWDGLEHRANDLSSENFRTAGFHIHIGYNLTKDNPFNKETFNRIIAKAFDIFVVIPSLNVHADKRRFENYGGLGQYRNTEYGVECRSLGAFFVNEQYLPWVIEQTSRMLMFLKDYNNTYSVLSLDKPVVKFVTDSTVTFDASVYEDLQLSYEEQIFNDKYKIYATV